MFVYYDYLLLLLQNMIQEVHAVQYCQSSQQNPEKNKMHVLVEDNLRFTRDL